jgi:hypothetical protein
MLSTSGCGAGSMIRMIASATLHGFGSPNAIGVRSWIPMEDKGKLYAGSSTWNNLKPGTAKDAPGWEFNQLTLK